MSALKSYLENLIKSINPFKYRLLSEQITKNAIKFFIITLTISIIISNILFLPNIIKLNNEIVSSIDSFEELNLDIQFKTKNPIEINLIDGKQIIIDSNNEISKNNTDILITENKYYYNNGKNGNNHEKFLNLKQNEEGVKKLLTLFVILILPTISIILYAAKIALFLLLVALVSLILHISFNKIKKNNKLKFQEVFNCGLYSSPLLGIKIILENITNISAIMYPVWISFFMMCVIIVKLKLNSKNKD